MTEADRIDPVVQQLISEIKVPENMEPRQILVHWTLELIKRVERESHLKGPQKLLAVQSTLMALLQKENAVFESSSLQKMFVLEEVPTIVSTAIALTKDPLFQQFKQCSWICK